MDFYILNTDAKSNGGRSPHEVWLDQGLAITSGPSKYLRTLSRLAEGDVVLAYANDIGVVGVGRVKHGECKEVRGAARVLPDEAVEYHREVDWLWDLRHCPIANKALGNYGFGANQNPVSKIMKGREGVPRLIAHLGEQGTADPDLCARRAALLMALDVAPREMMPVTAPPRTRTVETKVYERSPAVRAFALKRAGDLCELCGRTAPFKVENDDPFLEVHHVRPLAEGGFDSIDNAAALCPNCHRELHYGKERESKRRRLEEIVARANADMAPAPAR